MMNNLLRDLVVEEKIAVFIDDVIIAMEAEKGYDEIVEEVLRRLEKNTDLDKEIRVEADMSDFVTSGVLSMKCEDEKWRSVTYISKLLNEAERNYEIHNKKMLAII